MVYPTERAVQSWIRPIIEELEPDYVSGSLHLDEEHAFQSLESLRAFMESEARTYIAYFPALAHVHLPEVLDELLEQSEALEFFESLAPPPDTRPIPGAQLAVAPVVGRIISVDLVAVNDELITALAASPDLMRKLDPRRFEEVVARIFEGKGYDVVLTPRSRDGGRDVLAYRRDDVGTLLTLIECKRFAARRPVGVGVVRALYGTLEQERATHGIVAATSFFTSGARQFQERVQYRLSLADYERLIEWCAGHRGAANKRTK